MNVQKMLKKMQADMQRTQEELAEKTVEATVGGGKVTVVANGAGDGQDHRGDGPAAGARILGNCAC